jgi:colanic acid biosynthesis glycosyl transferase WcaI
MKRDKCLLIISQVYVPDPASVGQHMADAAVEMVKRGWLVRVLTADRGYDDPILRYKKNEVIKGVEVQRLPLSSFGKNSLLLRFLAGNIFVMQSIIKALLMRKVSCILVSTAPPMCSIAAVAVSFIRRIPIKYWVMDLNPDQMIELDIIKDKSVIAIIFNWLNRLVFKRAIDVIVLDRFMAKRVKSKIKIDISEKLHIIPPWPHQDALETITHEKNHFRKNHNLDENFVIMYSGNHSNTNPISTILEAAISMEEVKGVKFVFVGGGLGKKEVEDLIQDKKPKNIISLPYQPLEEIKYSLSAADIHLVSIGNVAVGVVHPCKVYGAMALSRPILYLGPKPSHVSDIIEKNDIGWHVMHNDVEGAMKVINLITTMPYYKLEQMGRRAKDVVEKEFSKNKLLDQFCNIIEHG